MPTRLFMGVEVRASLDNQKKIIYELKQAGGVAFIAYDFAQFQQSFEGRGLQYSELIPFSPLMCPKR
jgi:hypothetical protein